MRKLLDDLGIRCFSTHNDSSYLSPEKIGRTRDMNLILGSKYVVMASADPKPGPDGWKAVADALNLAADRLESSGLKAGYHNHQREFIPVENQRPIEILAKNTKPSIMLSSMWALVWRPLRSGGMDSRESGRIRSLHLKDWSPNPRRVTRFCSRRQCRLEKYFRSAESAGGVEYYCWNRKAAGSPNWRPPSGVFRAFSRCMGVHRKVIRSEPGPKLLNL